MICGYGHTHTHSKKSPQIKKIFTHTKHKTTKSKEDGCWKKVVGKKEKTPTIMWKKKTTIMWKKKTNPRTTIQELIQETIQETQNSRNTILEKNQNSRTNSRNNSKTNSKTNSRTNPIKFCFLMFSEKKQMFFIF